jgi:hypothetical protein
LNYTYESKAEPSKALSFGSGGIVDGYVGVIIRSDGKEVWRSNYYDRKQTAVLQSNRALPGFRQYLKEHGRCWFDAQQAKRQKLKDWKAAYNDVLAKIRTAAVRGVNARVIDGVDLDTGAARHGYLDGPEHAAFAAGYEISAALPPQPKR